MPTLLLVFILARLAANSACGTCVADCDWSVGEWGECSRSCGGGYQTRNRTLCCHDNESTETCLERCHNKSYAGAPDTHRTCNNLCLNGGKFDDNTGLCWCNQGWISTCCQEASTSYKFACSVSTRKTYPKILSQVAGEPESAALSRFHVVKAQLANELFTVETYIPQEINIVLRLCSHNVYSKDGCMVDHMSTSRDLLRNRTVIYNGGYLGEIRSVFLEVSQKERLVEYEWVPEHLDVSDQYSHLHCSRKMSHIQHPSIFRHRRWASRDLQILIQTSDSNYAGTDATVSMIIYGDKGSSRSMDMDGSFESGDVDTSMRSINEIGRIRSIRIWHNNRGTNAGWKLDWVRISELSEPGVTYEFGCSCWLEDNNNGKDLRHSTACPSISNCATQRCRTCTACQSPSKDFYFRLSADKVKCDTVCSYVSNRWCWPGNCYNGLLTSCSCDSGFRKSGTSTCDSECFTI
ncbi:uncharacterized protein LOC125384307 [Haliotis rufescens]|uniref:uncharacterized protein LOC125384307 n=1 Tax=Haliotis rufescens TaxID=6454 RepID=UPI00201ED582|nr:uncharacterized protein LOC125384307 [Haliotis rufescens]